MAIAAEWLFEGEGTDWRLVLDLPGVGRRTVAKVASEREARDFAKQIQPEYEAKGYDFAERIGGAR